MSSPRTKPYTRRGIRRCKCFRCGQPASQQWQICSDGNVYRAICLDCDIKLNELVLYWMGFPDATEKARRYEERMRKTYGDGL